MDTVAVGPHWNGSFDTLHVSRIAEGVNQSVSDTRHISSFHLLGRVPPKKFIIAVVDAKIDNN